MWTVIVGRVQSKCWPETVERLEPIVVYRRMICTKDILRKPLYTDDLAILVDEEAHGQEQLIEWTDTFSRHGLRVTLEMTYGNK